MKKILNICLLYILLSLIFSFCAEASSVKYNATKDFTGANPIGPWSYGYGTVGSSFSIYNYRDVSTYPGMELWKQNSGAVVPKISVNTTDKRIIYTGAVVADPGVLILHPGETSNSIIRWIAPTDGVYDVSGFFKIIDLYPNDTGVMSSVFVNEKKLLSTVIHEYNVSSLFKYEINFNKGDALYFSVGNAGNIRDDSTAFDATITKISSVPEPAGITLFVCGLVVLVGISRWRRSAKLGLRVNR